VNPGVKRRASVSGNAVGPKSLCEVRFFPDHGRHGTEGVVASVGARRLGGVEVQERRSPVVLKRTAGASRNRKPDGPGTSQGRTGGKQAIGFLGFLDGKTLKHAKTTEAENGVR
jgi:N-methylhydantoinase B/oxoprolinase/acetone carboxylase alpha subunit